MTRERSNKKEAKWEGHKGTKERKNKTKEKEMDCKEIKGLDLVSEDFANCVSAGDLPFAAHIVLAFNDRDCELL